MNGQEISDDWRFTKMYVREAGRGVWFHFTPRKQRNLNSADDVGLWADG
jgi:hypothetical protein